MFQLETWNISYDGWIWTDHGHEHQDEQKKHAQTFDEEAEKMIKSVKQALENGEGCRVCYSSTGS